MKREPIVAAFLYHSEADEVRDETVCKLVARVSLERGFGIEPAFRVRFADGLERDVLSSQLTPWYPT